MNRRIIPLIMCGGAGTRLWPASREVHPKQFLPLFGARSTFQDTILRVSDRGTVRASGRHHQQCLSLHGAGATRRDRPRGRRAARADAARLRARDRGRRCLCAGARRRCDRAGACRRPRGARHAGVPRGMPRGTGCGGSRTHRDLRRAARTRRHRIWLHQPRRRHCRQGSRGGEVRREAGSGDGGRLCQGRLSLEQRQLHVPRRRIARRVSRRRCRQRRRRSAMRCRRPVPTSDSSSSTRKRSDRRNRSRSIMR